MLPIFLTEIFAVCDLSIDTPHIEISARFKDQKPKYKLGWRALSIDLIIVKIRILFNRIWRLVLIDLTKFHIANVEKEKKKESCILFNLVTLACAGGFSEVVKILLSNGADINLGQSTPLMEASQEGHIELVQYLIENGIDILLLNFIFLFFFFLFVLFLGGNINQTTQAGDTGTFNL